MNSLPKRIDPDTYTDFALWRFDTAKYTILLVALWECDNPADHFDDSRDIDYANSGEAAHWFCAAVGVYDRDGDLVGSDYLGGCSYGSFAEFYSAHRWQYSRRQKQWIKDPKSRAWKACEARRPRRADGSRADGHYFPDMVRQAIREARNSVAMASQGARRA